MTKIELLMEEARQQQWWGQVQLHTLNLVKTVGELDGNGKRIGEDQLAQLFWNIIYAGNFDYDIVEQHLQFYAGVDADDQVSEAA